MSKLILIAGVSRSGKTSLAERLENALPKTLLIHLDEFTLEESLLPRIKDRIDWEKPNSIDWPQLKRVYQETKDQFEHILIEGIFAFSDLQFVEDADLTISLKLSKSQFYERRKLETRWGKEPSWFLDHVWQSHLKFENPHSLTPNIVIDEQSSMDDAALIARINAL